MDFQSRTEFYIFQIIDPDTLPWFYATGIKMNPFTRLYTLYLTTFYEQISAMKGYHMSTNNIPLII